MRALAILLALSAGPLAAAGAESRDELYRWAYAFIRKAQYDGAVAALDTALVIDPGYARGYWLRAFAHRHGGRPQRALADYTRSIELRPQFAWAFANRGTLRQELGDVDGALEDFNEAIRQNGRERDYYNSRGVAFRLKGRLDEALTDYDRAIELDPSHPTAYANRAIAWEHKGDLGRALEDADRALAIDPHYANALNTRAWIRATSSDHSVRDGTAAIEDARLACQLSRWETPNFIATLAAAHAEAAGFDRAVELQERYLKEDAMAPGKRALHEKILEGYRRGVPHRVAWQTTDTGDPGAKGEAKIE